ncbi:hypothetical protein Kpol_1006p3 [Vanderwaltozyma polyspora DSM 70294]|uniref:Cyclin N-terminal domain-containing protein n=1 Tax=Vanderwaltozyma polyspora (strain ATCC 22028 / DSM 70294 / BCRC 21397 / CBS 2163 / NBRC 10782 / NRRL Y-8283 / UCD 57-17) TaxID=436907 RepID=A7TQ39_VANPO|nr:uncharacterized protein Kpol_1006p3 [Vanderwaltozyma polyspora DSM 70294]EDO15607.1 hypothetical protein Kpol_1006p3 [Vanderwaltozyma polyspora DSM 70294]
MAKQTTSNPVHQITIGQENSNDQKIIFECRKQKSLTYPISFSAKQMKMGRNILHSSPPAISIKSLTPSSMDFKENMDQFEKSNTELLSKVRKDSIINNSIICSAKRRSDCDIEEERTQIKKFKTSSLIDPSPLINTIFSSKDDIKMVTEYADDIFEYLRERETDNLPTHNYLIDETSEYHVRPAMRAVLIDWLVEVHHKFQYTTETLLLAINMMDRFLSQNKVTVNKLQLLAITSLFVAAKFEEVKLPKITDYAYLTDGAASKEDIKQAEMYLFKCLNFDISSANAVNFMRRCSKNVSHDPELERMGKFLVELATCSPRFIDVKPSLTGGMSMYIARKVHSEENPMDFENVPSLNNNVDSIKDATFKNLCQELINEVVSPTTQVNSLINKFKLQSNNEVYSKVYSWCKNQVSNKFNNLF